jgi:hypothetical protein
VNSRLSVSHQRPELEVIALDHQGAVNLGILTGKTLSLSLITQLTFEKSLIRPK